MTPALYDLVSIVAIVSAILVITSSNPVISVVFLICVFVAVATYLILLGVGFIGISYVVVYVGAVAVLMLFVIMMINIRLAELSTVGAAYTKSMPVAFLIGCVMLYLLLSLIPSTVSTLGFINSLTVAVDSYSVVADSALHEVYTTIVPDTSISPTIGLQIHSIGTMLYSYVPMWLIIVGVVLLLAMVTPILLSKPIKEIRA